MRVTAAGARRAGRGGSVLGGHVGLALDRRLIAHLAQGRWIAVVSATNGKTTTTNLLAAALGVGGAVVTNSQGSNLKTGIAAALAADLDTWRAALEVDEATLAAVADELRPAVVVLGNLSRDQLDRYGEVRILAERWRAMFERLAAAGAAPAVVANADDPLVAWSASEVPDVTWVAAGAAWTADAAVCPACAAPIVHGPGTWRCTGCDLARPVPDVEVRDATVVFHDDGGDLEVPVTLAIPGRFNLGNAGLALAAARLGGVAPLDAAPAMATTGEVAGRYRTVRVGNHEVRLLMAKNPAGWQASLDIVQPPPVPVVVAVNARVADGRDPSWLWDVPFESLDGRPVVAAGDRAHDLSVRLHYAGVRHEVRPGSALDAMRTFPAGPVDLIANYTAFSDVLAGLR
jgi:UDP-N-acetylmuramyl tripeptide synthase